MGERVRIVPEYTFTVTAGRLRRALAAVRDEGDASILEFVMQPPDKFEVRVIARAMQTVAPVDVTLDDTSGVAPPY